MESRLNGCMANPENNEPNPNTLFKALSYGLSGANFICVMQFLFDSRAPVTALALLIGSMPILIVLGVLFGIFEIGKPPPYPAQLVDAQLMAIFAFVLATSASMIGFGKLFAVVNFKFALALGLGVVGALVVMAVVSRIIKKGGSE